MIPPIVQVARGIFAIGPIDTESKSTANTPFLVVGDRCAVVEIGENSQARHFLEGVQEVGIEFDRIDYLIPTHIHTHHVTAANGLLEALPNAKLVVHKNAVRHVMDPTRLNESTIQVWGDGVCSYLNPVAEGRIIGVSGGEVFDLGGRRLEVYDAGGHATHHLTIFDTLSRGAWLGDNCSFNSPGQKRGRLGVAAPFFDMEMGIAALRKAKELKPEMLFSWQGAIAHYPSDYYLDTAIEDGLKEEEIILDGLKRKLTAPEIGEKLEAYHKEVGLEMSEQDELEARANVPVGLINYLKKKYPELGLETPQGLKFRQR
ncbi:MAG: MBL fold metallo-hydrolase [Dehalococcoidales bacterium]|nr:MBL fold metallo-hydrolase [Dehalococcoidales bacterium]